MWGFWLLAGAALATSGVDDWLEAVVLIWQGDRMCAGVWVAPDGRFATAYHCVAGGRRVRVVTRSGTTWQGRVEAVDKGADLAVGRVTARVSVRALAIADASVAVGDEVWALGHPYGLAEPFGFFTSTLRWSASAGRVSAVGPVAVQFDAAVHPGHSGAPS